MNIVLDIGNTRVKVGYFEGKTLLAMAAYTHSEFPAMILASEEWKQYSAQSKYLGWVSVGKESMVSATESMIAAKPNLMSVRIDRLTPLPIANAYQSPDTLGMDRICVALAGWERADQGPVLVINAGTALTFDFVDAQDCYLGGGISLGLQTRFRALHDYTAALPLLTPQGALSLVGSDTDSCIRSGVIYGIIAEIEGIILRYQALAGPTLKVFLAGGDAEFLGNHLKNTTFVDANLLLYGINTLILHHAQ